MENNEEMEKFIKKLENQLKSAYRKYKNHVYYDNYSAIQRFDLAKFEVENFKISFVDKAEYEHNKDFEKAFDDYFSKLAYDLTNDWCNKIKNIIDNIDVISFPKNVESVNDKKNNIITNFKKSSSDVSKIHYFIDLPVEGHILGVLWILRLGYVLDDKLYKHCYGNRLNEYLLENLKENDNSEEYDFSPFLFQPYYKKYQSWRDDGLDVADNLLKNKKNAIILSLDFKDYYYRSLIDFKDLFEDIKDTQEKLNIQYDEIEEEFNNNLNNFIKEVFEIYSSKFNRKITNEALYPNENLDNKKHNLEYKKLPMIPLGFLPSLIIANWNLHGIDQIILEDVNHSYYGRYVDDILIVFGSHEKSKSNGIQHIEEINLNDFLNKYFTPNSKYPHNCIFKVNEKDDGNNVYKVYNTPFSENDEKYYHYENLEIQGNKLKMYKFSYNNSDAIIKNFRKEISKNSSEFKLMHDSESIKNELEDGIYKINYNDSINKLNSINDVKINKFEISKILSCLNHSSKYMNEKIDEKVVNEIFNAFKGNLLEFMSLWEKIFSFLYINNEQKMIFNLINEIISVINSIKCTISNNDNYVFNLNKDKVSLKNSLIKFLYYSIVRVLSLKSDDKIDDLNEYIKCNMNNFSEIDINNDICKCLFSSMQNNSLMKYPLQSTLKICFNLNRNKNKFKYNLIKSTNKENELFVGVYPRFIKLNELIYHEINNELFSIHDDNIKNINELNEIEYINNAIKNYYKFNFKNQTKNQNSLFKYIKFECGLNCNSSENKCFYDQDNHLKIIKVGNINKESIKVGILNTKLNENNIENRLKIPNLSQDRFDSLKNLINKAINQKIELLVMPEAYIPYEWVNEIVKISKDHQMAIIFGVEPIVNGDYVGNYIFATLPFIVNEKYFESILVYRLKNHYSPHELILFKTHDKKPIELRNKCNNLLNKEYHLIIWNDIYIAPYYCYEIADIKDRSIFKNCCDIVTVSEFNKDTIYFNNIAESLSRDLLCYCIKSNTSEYGGSMILQPTSSKNNYLINLKGGLNDYVVSYDLNIKKLREHAIKNDEFDDDNIFKPNPPGLSRRIIKKRMKLE